jgi:hypothetical protein
LTRNENQIYQRIDDDKLDDTNNNIKKTSDPQVMDWLMSKCAVDQENYEMSLIKEIAKQQKAPLFNNNLDNFEIYRIQKDIKDDNFDRITSTSTPHHQNYNETFWQPTTNHHQKKNRIKLSDLNTEEDGEDGEGEPYYKQGKIRCCFCNVPFIDSHIIADLVTSNSFQNDVFNNTIDDLLYICDSCYEKWHLTSGSNDNKIKFDHVTTETDSEINYPQINNNKNNNNNTLQGLVNNSYYNDDNFVNDEDVSTYYIVRTKNPRNNSEGSIVDVINVDNRKYKNEPPKFIDIELPPPIGNY